MNCESVHCEIHIAKTVTEEELNILETIYQRFKSDNSTKISDISHNEDAWQKYVDSGQMINFDMAFSLKAI